VGAGFVFGDGFGFDVEEVCVDGATGHYGLWRAYEAELADGEAAFFVRHRRAERAARNGSRGVEVAGAGDGVEDGAGFVVGEFVEGGFVVGFGEELSGERVAGEIAAEAGAGF
jgi:hypothetical protein